MKYTLTALCRAFGRFYATASTLTLRWGLSHTPSIYEASGASDYNETAMGCARGPAPVNLKLSPRKACSPAAAYYRQSPLGVLVSLVLVSGWEL